MTSLFPRVSVQFMRSIQVQSLRPPAAYARGMATKPFHARRRPNRNYRPVANRHRLKSPAATKFSPVSNPNMKVDLSSMDDDNDELDDTFGSLAASAIRDMRQERGMDYDEQVEETLRMADFYNSPEGSTADFVGQRRGLAGETEADRLDFLESLEDVLEEGRLLDMGLTDKPGKVEEPDGPLFGSLDDDVSQQEDKDPDVYLDPNQLAHGEWSEMLVTVDRNIKLWRGGRLESYRALVIGGNLNGCGGFGIGKSVDPIKAVDIAGRMCKRNIFFVRAHQGNGLTRDLVGKQNSCSVILRATDNGLRGNELVREILKRFGITNCVAKSHGNRNPFNVVRATFKALMTHESLQEIALKRGKRLVSVDRAIRMQV